MSLLSSSLISHLMLPPVLKHLSASFISPLYYSSFYNTKSIIRVADISMDSSTGTMLLSIVPYLPISFNF